MMDVFFVIFPIILCSLSLIFRKRWGKSILWTFISALLIVGAGPIVISSIDYWYMQVITDVVVIAFYVYFIKICLQRYDTIVLIKAKAFWLTCALLVLINLVFLGYADIFLGIKSSWYDFVVVFIKLIFAPVFESLLFHEICYSGLIQKTKSKYFSLSALLSLVIAIWHFYSVTGILVIFVLFFSLYVLRYFWRGNKSLYAVIFIHGLYNFVSFLINFFRLWRAIIDSFQRLVEGVYDTTNAIDNYWQIEEHQE